MRNNKEKIKTELHQIWKLHLIPWCKIFFEKAQFRQSFKRFTRNSKEIVSTPHPPQNLHTRIQGCSKPHGNYAHPQNFYTRKLGENSVSYAVLDGGIGWPSPQKSNFGNSNQKLCKSRFCLILVLCSK